MLGMTPVLGRFFGLPLDVRHVTLNTGIMALGAAGLGRDWFRHGWLLIACAGIAVTFVLNLSVSFLLALRLALQAYDVPSKEWWQILKSFGSRFVRSPQEFLLPPGK